MFGLQTIFRNFAIGCGLIFPATIEIIMGIYINKGNNAFRNIVNSEYVDKTSLIPYINKTLNTERRYSRVTRSRRFGKSMTAKMATFMSNRNNMIFRFTITQYF